MAADSLSYLQQYEGKVVPFSFNAGYVGLSYVVSLVGAASTLELIRRRTSHKGIHNLLLLAGAAVCMGGIAIWSMHYVGNRAIAMLDGEAAFQIAYDTKLTVLSFFMPILVLLVAFVVVTASAQVAWWRIYLSGSLSGGAICGMHYIANLSISNYHTTYHISYVVGAALIAVLASSAALALFFVFETSWTNSWWKRAGCAMVLAGAVSGMHWCAAVGTQYTLIASSSTNAGGSSVSRSDTTIIVACLSIAACAIITASLMFSTYVRRVSARKAQKVVLASAVFDSRGRIMVSYEGILPSQVVTTAFIPRTSSEFFDTAHPIFHWMFRASRSWASVAGLIDPMQRHMEQLSRSKSLLVDDDGTMASNYNLIICEMFCLAAVGLASLMKESLQDVGKLWDEILTTGNDGTSLATNHRPKTPANPTLSPRETDVESVSEKSVSSMDHGRGSLMFLVRHVRTHEEVEKLKAEGYRFAEIHQVVGNIRSNMQILTPDLLDRLRRMSEPDSTADSDLRPGVYLGAFVLRARLDHNNSGGFDVLVQKDARNRLPSKLLPIQELQEWHHAFLKHLHGLTVSDILQRLRNVGNTSKTREALFSRQIFNALVEIRDGFKETIPSDTSDSSVFDNAILIPQITQLRCVADSKETAWGTNERHFTCSLICFRLVLPIHTRDNLKAYQVDPLPFFKTRQLVYPGSPQQVKFSHQIHRDVMASVLKPSPSEAVSKPKVILARMGAFRLLKKKAAKSADKAIVLQQLERSSREGLTLGTAPMSNVPHDEKSSSFGDRKDSVSSCFATDGTDLGGTSAKPLGGIMVSQQVVVDIEDRNVPAKNTGGRANLVSQQDSPYTAITIGSDAQRNAAGDDGQQLDDVFVDELFRLCISSYVAR